MKLFDSHAHYYDSRFDELGGAECLLDGIFADNPEMIILNVGTNNENSRICIVQAEKYPRMYATAGIHPLDCKYLTKDISEEMTALEKLFSSDKSKKTVALGEIGLDYHYEGYDKTRQREYFDAQMSLAKKYALPVIVHNRESHGDCLEMIKKHPDVTGVFHSFSGSAEAARELNKRGWYVSFSGTLTFKNAAKVREAARAAAPELILIETDAPYLAPHPHRGQINHSALAVHTVRALAEVRGISESAARELTHRNACRLFGISDI